MMAGQELSLQPFPLARTSPVLFLYTCISVTANLVLTPILIAASLAGNQHKRRKIMQRLGLALTRPNSKAPTGPIIWIHALSVGEVTSALPLVRGLRETYPDAIIYFSVTTTAGLKIARDAAKKLVDDVLFAPFDLFFTVRRFLRLLSPDIFILVETDFWPEWLRQIHDRNIPAVLVNGRFSRQSIRRYQRFAMLFRPMFSCFSLLAMQTEEDGRQLRRLGLPPDRIRCLGNLKFDAGSIVKKKGATCQFNRSELGISDQALLLVCGSTHPGEEEIIFSALAKIHKKIPELRLILAPRDIARGEEIIQLARQAGFSTRLRSRPNREDVDILVLDTLGELAGAYHLADLAFIGGSLIQEGGHNPIEAAAASIPVLFGPHMEDFSEISAGLLQAGGALRVSSSDDLACQIKDLLGNPDTAKKIGQNAGAFVRQGQGVVNRHLDIIDQLLGKRVSRSR